eukprot:s2366_g6.t2
MEPPLASHFSAEVALEAWTLLQADVLPVAPATALAASLPNLRSADVLEERTLELLSRTCPGPHQEVEAPERCEVPLLTLEQTLQRSRGKGGDVHFIHFWRSLGEVSLEAEVSNGIKAADRAEPQNEAEHTLPIGPLGPARRAEAPEVAAIRPEAVLSHRSCPWGGHLIKMEATNVFIQNAPSDPANLFVRPEVRALSPAYAPENHAEYAWRCLETYEPGNALMERMNCMWAIRMFSVLFGHSQGSTREHFFQKVRTETPPMWERKPFRLPVVCQTLRAAGTAWYLSSAPQKTVGHASLCRQHFPAFTDMFRKMFERVVNGPGFCDMREADARMYLVLSMRNFNRGHPMVPQRDPSSDESFHVSAGEHLGLVSWTRFKPDEKFQLSEYMRVFMERLGHQLRTYRVMDGRELVPYQCAVVGREWNQLKTSFYQAFKVQKAAYRHGNGGSKTPSLTDDASPHFLPGVHQGELQAPPKLFKTTVRKTFVELEEGSLKWSKRLKRSLSTGEVMTKAVDRFPEHCFWPTNRPLWQHMVPDFSAWMSFAPSCMSDADWEVAAETSEVVLSHRSCPWGGRLIKMEVPRIFIEDAPEDSKNLFVRPEVRHLFQGPLEMELGHVKTFAPGDALMDRGNSMWMVRVAAVLFGHCQGSAEEHWLGTASAPTRYRLYRGLPEPGDCIYVASEAMYLARRLPNSASDYRLVFVFHTPFGWTPWAVPFLHGVCQMFYQAANRLLNAPRYRCLRALDAKMYLVLSMRTFNRGPPMIPHDNPCAKDSFHITAGEPLGLVFWTRFNAHGKFHLSEYVRSFMERLGHPVSTYEVMDGRKLVPYQCVVVRQQWDELRTSFAEAFRVQKAAYRHANGGSSTPSLTEDARPRWISASHEVCPTDANIKSGCSVRICDASSDSTSTDVSTFFV